MLNIVEKIGRYRTDIKMFFSASRHFSCRTVAKKKKTHRFDYRIIDVVFLCVETDNNDIIMVT